MDDWWGAVIWLGAIGILILASRRARGTRRGGGVGSAAAGALHGWLNEPYVQDVVVRMLVEAEYALALRDFDCTGGLTSRRPTGFCCASMTAGWSVDTGSRCIGTSTPARSGLASLTVRSASCTRTSGSVAEGDSVAMCAGLAQAPRFVQGG